MKYIYWIICGDQAYIGQSSASTGGNFARMFEHIKKAYYLNKSSSTEEKLSEVIRNFNLNQIEIRIYPEEINYGIDQAVFDKFFTILEPYKSRVMPTDYKGTNNVIQATATSPAISELDKLDAAEILHIVIGQQKYHLLNSDMGGQYYGWTLRGTDTLLFQKASHPAEALKDFEYTDTKLSGLQNSLDKAIKSWMTSEKSMDSWVDFVHDALIKKLVDKTKNKEINAAVQEETYDWLLNRNLSYTNSNGALDRLRYHIAKECGVSFPQLTIKLKKPREMAKSISQVLADVFAYKLTFRKKSYPNIEAALNDLTFASGKDISFSISQIIDIEGSGLPTAQWWKTTLSSPTYTEMDLQLELKKIAVYTFKKIFNDVVRPNIYTADTEDISIIKKQWILPDRIETSNSLSTRIHNRYRDNFSAPFVENQWREFYGPMVSYKINSYDPWEFMNYDDEEFAYREESTLEANGEEYYIAHVVKDEDIWLTNKLENIFVY